HNRIYDVSRQRQADFDKADQQRGRYDRCARGEDNWESVRAIPEVSGRSAWSDVTREAPQWTRASRAERPRNEESEAAANTRTAQATPQETSSAQQSQGGESLQVEFDGLALLPFVAGLFAVFAAGGLFFAFSANSSKSSRFDIDEMEERSPDDWTKRAIRKVSDRTDA
ncbi:MAG: hypothetical protein RLZ98_2028, partial [Pseudomonadota bacterium]